MRLPNLTSSNAITSKIRDLDQQRFKMDRQITSGQKLRLPEDDGMRLGRVIRLETQKGQLTQYQRNASYADEFLNAGHLNLDKLTELNQRAQEIARSAGSSLSGPAMETYGFEINQLIEEALNRINATHRKQALFGGTKLKPKFSSSEVLRGKSQTQTFSFNEVAQLGADGKRRMGFGDEIIIAANGREYVLQSKVDGLDTTEVAAAISNLINNQSDVLSQSLSYENTQFKAFVRGANSSSLAYNPSADLKANVSVSGDLILQGAVGQTYDAKSTLLTHWDPNYYMPEQFDQKLKQETATRYPGVSYEELGQTEKAIIQEAVKGIPSNLSKALDDETARQFPPSTFTGISSYADLSNTQKLDVYKAVVQNNWSRDLTVNSKMGDGSSGIQVAHAEDWKRLSIYQAGDVARFEGKLYESIGSHNVNHDPAKSGTEYWRELHSGYDTEREDWKLEVAGTENRYYWIAPDGKLFDDQTSAVSHAQTLLWSAKKTEYTLLDNPATAANEGLVQLNQDVANNVRQVAIPVNEFLVQGSENKGTVFFDSESMDYRLVAASKDGAIIDGPYIKGNQQLHRPGDALIQAKDVVLHEGRYFLVNTPSGIDKDNLSKIVSSFPPSGTVVSYSGQVQKVMAGQGTQLSAGQYILDPATSQYYLANQKVNYTSADLTQAITNAQSVATALGNPSQSISLPVSASAFSVYNSSPYSAGEVISPDGLTTKVATNQMRGTFDPKKTYNSQSNTAAIDPQTNTSPLLPHIVYGGVSGGKGSYFKFVRDHLGEWQEGQAVSNGQTTFRDGKLWRSVSALTSAQNTDANFSSNWSSLGSSPTVQSLLGTGSVTDVSSAVEAEATAIPTTGTTVVGNYFQDTLFNTTPISGLDMVSNGPQNITVAKGQYVHDTTSGEYFLAKGDITIDLASAAYSSGNLSTSSLNLVTLTERSDGNAYLLGDRLPTEGKELSYFNNQALVAKAGDYVYDPSTKDYYVAIQNINKPADWADGSPYASGDLVKQAGLLYTANKTLTGSQNTTADFSVNWDLASTWAEGVALKSGTDVYKDGNLYTAKKDLSATENTSANLSNTTFWTQSVGVPDYSLPLADTATSPYFMRIGSQQGNGPHASQQGEDWSSTRTYDYNQIVHYQGSYYRCLAASFNNKVTTTGSGSTQDFLVKPSDALIPSTNALFPNAMVANDKWVKIEEPLNHVMKFKVDNTDAPSVTIKSAGTNGTNGEAEAIVDAYGKVVGLKVVNPGRYFFGTSLGGPLPPDFQLAKIILPNGQEMDAEILWGQNPKDPGPYTIQGFNIAQSTPVTGATSKAQTGDTFSFATGTKTFLDHRDENGNVVNITYTGGTKDSEYYVGNETKLSGFLSASKDGTKELGDAVNTIIDLRDSFKNTDPSLSSQAIEDSEKKLISQEETLIDKMGELSSRMVRMNTVRAHDEDYFMQLDQRISKDVDIDLSEAIMRLTRISTAYQASLQVGSQLLNTSLLNYL
jgi:flagellin-like hook-associated protein FlgL